MYVKPIKVSDCMKQVTLKVRITGLVVHKIRMFFSINLIKLAALIGGYNFELDMVKNEK